jgi:hydrogenase maturation protein HypF
MACFELCPECRKEYENPANRRFHAEPNACPVCGPRLKLFDSNGIEIMADPLSRTAELLKEGWMQP